MTPPRTWRAGRGLAVAIAALVLTAGGWVAYALPPLVRVDHVAEVYPRRAPEMTANVTGARALAARVEYRSNGGEWRVAPDRGAGRVERGDLLVEIPPSRLAAGRNELEIRASAPLRPMDLVRLSFEYDPSPVELPVEADWQTHPLEVADGLWERVQVEGEWRVRPVPGTEAFDRLLVVCGAFPGGRRVETSMVFRGENGPVDHGFGVLVLWGGRPDDPEYEGVRRGWRFGLAWWYSRYGGAAGEFSEKRGGAKPDWVHAYRNVPLEPGRRHHVVAEAWPEVDEEGRHERWVLREKWWLEGDPEPQAWIEVADVEGAPIAGGEYAVALLAHWTQVEFGPVRVLPLGDDGW